ncbi:hypothetical protein MBRA1_002824 [Malassezia brasiliensis]|uniref:MICOS complex subunit n=1 Tax=Malassezia brasiliensis TaxID=1821822 RepID=A0AAF0ITR6_9BASI|nr:hypothetical protein MBRA1_002824 [Malassezia brasiliensis]
MVLEKLSIYPQPDQPVTVVETSNELERQVGGIREAVQRSTRGALQSVRSGVDRVVNAENRVENRFDQIVAKDESLTPNALYVGVATLASVVFTRYRSFPIRWFTPPLVLALSFKYFLPNTFDNTAEYYDTVEHRNFPRLSEKRQDVWSAIKRTYFTGVSHLERTGEQAKDALASGFHSMENSTGLKLGSVLPSGTVPESAPKLADKTKLV